MLMTDATPAACTRMVYAYVTNMGRPRNVYITLDGAITAEQKAAFEAELVKINGFNTGRRDCFDPSLLGLPSLQDEDEGDMTPWHELVSFELVSGPPTVERHVDEVIAAMTAGAAPAAPM